ncbi:MAG: A24 family peptidase [Parvularcula sp.]
MSTLISLLLPGFVVAAAIFDLRSFKIPNGLIVAMLAAWPVAVLLTGTPIEAAGQSALLGLALLIVGIVLFSRGWLGAGDGKLISATSLYVGVQGLSSFAMATALAGAALAVMLIMFRRMPVPSPLTGQSWVRDLHARTGVMPYGVAIAAGAVFTWGQGLVLIN